MATSCNNIGAVYEKKGDLENALLQFQRALEIRTRVFGSEHLDVAASYNMGMVYEKQDRCEEALDYYHRSLEIRTRVFGSEHLDVQYYTAEWKPAFLRQAREFLFFPLLPGRQVSEFPFSTEKLGLFRLHSRNAAGDEKTEETATTAGANTAASAAARTSTCCPHQRSKRKECRGAIICRTDLRAVPSQHFSSPRDVALLPGRGQLLGS